MAEKEHFENMYLALKGAFPRFCSKCSSIFASELDYNNKTSSLKGHMIDMDDTEQIEGVEDVSRLFLRNCNGCDSTLSLVLDPKKFSFVDKVNFLGYVSRRASRQKRNVIEVFEDVRDEYNQWLVERNGIPNHLILGIGDNPQMREFLDRLKSEDLGVLHTSDYLKGDGDILRKTNTILTNNPDRMSLILLEADKKYFPEHEKLVGRIRRFDQKYKRHTNIVGFCSYNDFTDCYNSLDLNGTVQNVSSPETKEKIMSYLVKRK